jgi:2,4-dienoyl-CoA reductase-like NADH-dependent reductase (Old Yellow Enzyme family)
VRAVWPADKPLGVRVSATDWVEGGWDIEQTVVFARALQARGCDWLDVSSGGVSPAQKIPLGPGYQVPFAERVRAEVDMPIIGEVYQMIYEDKPAQQAIKDLLSRELKKEIT